jgi:Aspartyl protease
VTPSDDPHYQPPAPVASLTLRTLDGRDLSISKVLALVDTGADVTVLPRWAVEQLGMTPQPDGGVQLA